MNDPTWPVTEAEAKGWSVSVSPPLATAMRERTWREEHPLGALWTSARKTRVYIAGKMRGIDQFNFPAFDEAATNLRYRGYEVRSPAEHDREQGFDETKNTLEGFDLEAAFTWDFESIKWAHEIVLLPGWENSKGATAEYHIAQALGKPVYEYLMGGQLLPLLDEASTKSHDGLLDNFHKKGDFHSDSETRATSESGGQKGRKLARFSLLPVESLWEVAEVYGFGAKKYTDHNWRKGMPFSWLIDALLRHVEEFRAGADVDPESKLHHLAHAVFHCFALMEYGWLHPDKDDRIKTRAA